MWLETRLPAAQEAPAAAGSVHAQAAVPQQRSRSKRKAGPDSSGGAGGSAQKLAAAGRALAAGCAMLRDAPEGEQEAVVLGDSDDDDSA